MNANYEYVAAYVADVFGRLCPLAPVDLDAAAFGNALDTGSLPLPSVSVDIQLGFCFRVDVLIASFHRQVQRAGHAERCVRVRDPKTHGLRAPELMTSE